MSPSRKRAPATERTTTRDGLIQAALHLFRDVRRRGDGSRAVLLNSLYGTILVSKAETTDRPMRLLRLAFEPVLLPRGKA
jgi:hypothetical protein